MPSDRTDIAHLLRRVGFGGTRAEVDSLAELDWEVAVERVLDTSAVPPADVGLPDLSPTRSWWDRYVDMTWFWLERARTTPVPLAEKLVLFWHGLLCSSLDKVGDHQMMFDQNQLFRSHGLGDVVSLYQSMAVQPAMLRYLDGDRNRVGAPNENFSRELMELFTLGPGHYSQDDVVASARAWTGHGVAADGSYRFNPARHDDGIKTFLGTSRNWDGPEVVDHLFNGPTRQVAARYLAARLWSFLAYPGPEAALVAELGAAFLAADLRIDALVRAILLRPEFRSPAARHALVRSPVEYVVAAMRHTGTPCSTARPEWYLEGLGQQPFYPPDVSGWRQNGYWLSASASWRRSAFADRLAWRLSEAGVLAGSESKPVEVAVDDALTLCGIHHPSDRTRQALAAYVRAERSTTRWAERRGLLFLTLLTPEFQVA